MGWDGAGWDMEWSGAGQVGTGCSRVRSGGERGWRLSFEFEFEFEGTGRERKGGGVEGGGQRGGVGIASAQSGPVSLTVFIARSTALARSHTATDSCLF